LAGLNPFQTAEERSRKTQSNIDACNNAKPRPTTGSWRLIRHQGDQFWPLMGRLKRELGESEDPEKILVELLGDNLEKLQPTPR